MVIFFAYMGGGSYANWKSLLTVSINMIKVTIYGNTLDAYMGGGGGYAYWR